MLKKRALALAAVLTLGLIPTLPSYAVTTYASPADLIEDVVEVALTGVTSPTKGDALTEMKGKITLTGDEVFYDGTSIGYWYSDDSSTIYTTESQVDTVVVSDGSSGWEVEPLIFEDILADVNEDLIENVVPTTADWSKIIGKYDVTLGELTIPADQWIETTPASTIDVSTSVNITDLCGIPSSDMDNYLGDNTLYIGSYTLKDGKLYVQPGLIHVYMNTNNRSWGFVTIELNSVSTYCLFSTITNGTAFESAFNTLRAGVNLYNNSIPYTAMFLSDTLGTVSTKLVTYPAAAMDYGVNIANPTERMSYYSDTDRTGIFYATGYQMDVSTSDEVKSKWTQCFTSQSSSKKVIGNTALTKRLAKLSNLAASDTIVFTTSGWTVNGLEDLDSYISTSILTEAGQSATMDGAVEIEELNFKVVVPSTLPMVADSEGNVQVASNASIDNKSNAKVKITGLEIEANSESGWTMVGSNPSKTRGANEFTFGTSLSIGDEIAKGDALEFTYNADLSPAEQGVDSVDLVTLTITLDWAE